MDSGSRTKIIDALCLTGQYPLDRYDLISDEQTSSYAIYRMLLNMRKEKLLTIRWKGGYKKKAGKQASKDGAARKGEKAEKVIQISMRVKDEDGNPVMANLVRDTMGEEAMRHLKNTTDKTRQKSTPAFIARELRRAEAMIILQKAGISVLPYKKPILGSESFNTDRDSTYYDSIEIKNTNAVKNEVYSRSRFLGIILSPGGAYIVYNLKSNVMQLFAGRERNLRNAMRDIVLAQSNINQGSSYAEADSAIMFGHKDKQLLERILDWEKGPYTELRNIYRRIHYCPVSQDAGMYLWMLTQPNWRSRLLRGLIVEKYLVEENYYVTHDAYIPEQDLFVLCWLDSNLVSLKLLTDEVKRENHNKYALICLPWQEEIVREYLGDNVQILEVTPQHITGIFEKGGS